MAKTICTVAVCVCLFAPLPAFAQKPKPPDRAEFDALVARVAKLESGAITVSDIVGTWLVVSRGIALHSNPPSVGEDFTTATLRFQSDGTGTIGLTGANSTLHLSAPATLERETGTTPDIPFTWVLTNSGVVMTMPDGGKLGGYIGAGGRTFLISSADTNGADGSWSDVWSGIKLPN
jgi:hypothetical protein